MPNREFLDITPIPSLTKALFSPFNWTTSQTVPRATKSKYCFKEGSLISGKIFLSLIEVQSGSYVGEDDIVRFEDKYGRKN